MELTPPPAGPNNGFPREGVPTSSGSDVLTDTIRFAIIALLIVVPIRWFVAQPFIVRGASMEPTFYTNEYLIVDQLTYRFEDPERGDVVVMRYPKDPSVSFIKRVIGLPGETVEIQGRQIIIRRGAGTEPIVLDQSFIDPARMKDEYQSYALSDDEYFVMGDNRVASSDSRAWGNLPRENIIGRALVRLWPVMRADILPGKVSFPAGASSSL